MSPLTDALTWGLDHAVPADAGGLAAFLARSLGPTTVAVLHYGSRAQGRQPRADSAYDFFVVVDRYRAAYDFLAATVGISYSPALATALAHILPPNVIAVTDRGGDGHRAKCCVISLSDFKRACSPRRRDHFVQGRLFQFVVMAWSRDNSQAQEIRDAIAQARAATFVWGRSSLPERFTVDEYVHSVLGRSLDGEIRPEVGDHARTLADAQQQPLRAIYAPLLQSLAERGDLVTDSPAAADHASTIYRQRVLPTWLDRSRTRWYFQRSKVRATLRLLKHVVLYEGWLDYIVRKIDRSGDTKIELTRREQRWPLIFLWPRVFRYLRDRPQRRRARDTD
ncbi:MAG: hypothetical protein ABIP90_11360 [Vicinamibacterales bacterium]